MTCERCGKYTEDNKLCPECERNDEEGQKENIKEEKKDEI